MFILNLCKDFENPHTLYKDCKLIVFIKICACVCVCVARKKELLQHSQFSGQVIGWKIWVLIPGWSKRFFSSQNIQASSGTHPDSFSMGTRIISPGVQQPGHEVDHSHLVPRLRMCGAIPILLLPAFMAWRGTTPMRAHAHTHTHTHTHQ